MLQTFVQTRRFPKMTYTYKKAFDQLNNVEQNNLVQRIDSEDPNTVMFINLDQESDAKDAYLAWIAEGNTPAAFDS